MARFDVYRTKDGQNLLDCQADVLAMLSTRIVVPLIPPDEGPPAIDRLNPAFTIEDRTVVMFTQFAASVPAGELRRPIASLIDQHDTIMNALDMLITGY